MNTSNRFKSSLVVFALFTLPTLVQAQSTPMPKEKPSDYQEVTYEELLNELSTKKTTLTKAPPSALDSVMIHAGLGYVNSFSNFRAQDRNLSRYQNGLQLSLGIDLFSPNWYSEGTFKNYGLTTEGSEDISLKEFDLKVGYKAPLSQVWSYSFNTGIANRFLKISDPSQNVHVDETTPSMMIGAGFFATPSKNISLGVEANVRTPFLSQTADKDSFDFALKVITSL